MEAFTLFNPTKLIFGAGQVECVGRETALLGATALLVTGHGSVKRSGLYETVTDLLSAAGVACVELAGVDPNPRIETVVAGAALARSEKVDVVVAVGGGSVIDCAKGIALAAPNDADPWGFYDRTAAPKHDPLPLGTILTLAATGSEANGATVVSRPAIHAKRAMYHPGLFPRFSILDPALTVTVPREHTANGVVDILSHIFEQYFHTVDHTPIQDGFAETLMRTVIAAGERVMTHPTDARARADLMWSSTVALMGILKAGVRGDWSCHMIAHELAGHYDTPHGAALAVVFPSWMRSVFTANLPRFVRFATRVWGIDPTGKRDEELALAGIEATERYFTETLKVGVRLSDYGIGDEKIAVMAAAAAGKSPATPLVPITEELVAGIFAKAL
jgi:alcohol dehydrogenase YqhD (iron-dependent ADH family)